MSNFNYLAQIFYSFTHTFTLTEFFLAAFNLMHFITFIMFNMSHHHLLWCPVSRFFLMSLKGSLAGGMFIFL